MSRATEAGGGVGSGGGAVGAWGLTAGDGVTITPEAADPSGDRESAEGVLANGTSAEGTAAANPVAATSGAGVPPIEPDAVVGVGFVGPGVGALGGAVLATSSAEGTRSGPLEGAGFTASGAGAGASNFAPQPRQNL